MPWDVFCPRWQVSTHGHGPKMGGFEGFGDVWDVYGPGDAAGSGAAASRCIPALGIVGRHEHHIIVKKNPIWPQNYREKADSLI